jgi:hypothetical protein
MPVTPPLPPHKETNINPEPSHPERPTRFFDRLTD